MKFIVIFSIVTLIIVTPPPFVYELHAEYLRTYMLWLLRARKGNTCLKQREF